MNPVAKFAQSVVSILMGVALAFYAPVPIAIALAVMGICVAVYCATRRESKPEPPVAPVPTPEPLTPGDCECGHNRCTHADGVGKCNGQFPPDEKTNEWLYCACMIYIRDDDEDDDDEDDEPEPETPSVDELERLMRK